MIGFLVACVVLAARACHIVIIAAGRSENHSIALVSSILFHRSTWCAHLEIHVFVSPGSRLLWNHFAPLEGLVCFSLHVYSCEWLLKFSNAWIRQTGFVTGHHAAAGGSMMKLFVHEEPRLARVKRAIVLDSDMVVTSDIAVLLDSAFAPAIRAPEIPNGVCSCFMVMQLDILRSVNFTAMLTSMMRRSASLWPGGIWEADQTLIKQFVSEGTKVGSQLIAEKIDCSFQTDQWYYGKDWNANSVPTACIGKPQRVFHFDNHSLEQNSWPHATHIWNFFREFPVRFLRWCH